MNPDPSQLILIFSFGTLLILSGFFSAAEVAFISLSPAKIRALKEEQPGQITRLITRLTAQPERLLTTILIGNNLVNIFTASLATVVAMQFFGSAGLGIATGVVTLGILIFGEILPKGFAQRHAVGFARFAALPLSWLSFMLTPITFIFERLFHAVGGQHQVSMTEEELLAAVDIGTEGGELHEHEREFIQNVLEFTDTRVEEVMTPRVDIDAISYNRTIREAKHYFIDHSHSRLPVFEQSIDRVVGVVTLRHILEHRGEQDALVSSLQLLRPIFTPASRPIRSLFAEFKSRHIHIAIVVDEHGGTLGLVTLEDLLEEIVGEIEDEGDIPDEGIIELNKNVLLVPADTPLCEIDERLDTALASDEFETKNVAFLILEKLGRMAKENDRIRAGGAELTVEQASKNKIEKVKIEKIN